MVNSIVANGTAVPQVADLMAPAPEVLERREETQAALAKLREAEQMLYDLSKMDAKSYSV